MFKSMIAAAVLTAGLGTASAEIKWGIDGRLPKEFVEAFTKQVGSAPLDSRRLDEAELRFHVGCRCPFAKSLGLDFETLHPYGYYLVKKGADVLFAGRNGRADNYAAFDFLKRYTGYRNFGGQFGLVIPVVRDLRLPAEFSFREEPDVISYRCQWCPAYEPFCRSDRLTCQATHAMDQMITTDMYATHPEYFPLVSGKRVAPGDPNRPWNPCMSNPDLPKLFRAYAKRYFERNPNAISVPMGVNDGGGDCNCKGCEALYEKHGNQYVEFYNAAAKVLQDEFPGKMLAFIGYSVRCGKAPVDGYQMESNVLVEVTGNVNNYGEWRKAGVRNFGTYEYFYQLNNTRIAPACYSHCVAERLRSLRRDYGLNSLWHECFAASSVFDGGRQYVVDELMWNMDADVDALLEDYHSSMYGAAAKAMRRFSDTADEAFRDNSERTTYFSEYRDPLQFNGYTFERIAAMDAALKEASTLAAPGSVEARRIDIVAKYWAVSRLFADNWQCARALARETNPRRIVELSERGMRDIESIDRQRLSPEDERYASTNGKTGFFEEWKKLSPFAPLPPLEKAADRAFARIVSDLGDDKARKFLKPLVDHPYVGLFAAAQLAILDGGLVNVAQNGGFEELSNEKPGSDADTDWESLGQHGWNWSRFPSTQAKAWTDDTEAHSGKHSVAIGPNPLGCWVLTQWKAEPSARYRISFWAKRNDGLNSTGPLGSLTVRMKDAKGNWLDDGSAISENVTTNSAGKWAEYSIIFSTPDAAGDVWIVPVLTAPNGQKRDARLWFDDVKMEKLCNFRWHAFDQVVFAEVTLRDWLRNWDVEWPELKRDDTVPEGAFEAKKRLMRRPLIRGGEEGLRIGLYAWAQAQGVRWFSPAESPVVPSRPEEIADLFWGLHVPSFPYRGLHVCGSKDHFDPVVAHWMSFNGMNRRLDTLDEAWRNRDEIAKYGLKSDTCVHSFDTLIPAKRYFKEHPEYFALVGGERKNVNVQRCLSNLGFRKSFADELAGWMEKLPNAAVYGVCPNDGYGWCECEACKAMDTAADRKAGTVNGRMASFVRELCDRFSGRTIGNYSYSNFRDFYRLYDKTPENLMLSTTISHCQGHPLNAAGCPTNVKVYTRLKELADSKANFYVYDYYTYLWDGLPAPMWKTVEADMKELHRLGCRGFLSEVSPHGHDSWDGFAPALYVAARMLYDATQTADALVEDWCRVRYGAAAKEMIAYFMEWGKGLPTDRCFNKKPEDFARIFQPSAEAHLTAAESTAPENHLVAKSRRLFNAWKNNLAQRKRWPTIRKVKLGKKLEKVVLHFVRNSTQLADETNPTETEMALEDDKIHVRLTMKESKMWNLKSVKGDPTAGDGVELFFRDGMNEKDCYHFLVNALGEVAASECNGTRWNWNWKHNAHIVVEKFSNRWTVDFTMPLSDINAIDEFDFSIVRNRHAGGSWEIFGVPAGGAFFNTSDYIRAVR